MLRDAVPEGATVAEIVALARLADDAVNAPPPHLRPALRARGWMTQTETGGYRLTAEGRTLVEKAN